MTENSFFDLDDVIADRKIVSELTHEGKYYYLTKHYCPKDQNLLHKKKCIKGGEPKTERISFCRFKTNHDMLTVKNFKVCSLIKSICLIFLSLLIFLFLSLRGYREQDSSNDVGKTLILKEQW